MSTCANRCTYDQHETSMKNTTLPYAVCFDGMCTLSKSTKILGETYVDLQGSQNYTMQPRHVQGGIVFCLTLHEVTACDCKISVVQSYTSCHQRNSCMGGQEGAPEGSVVLHVHMQYHSRSTPKVYMLRCVHRDVVRCGASSTGGGSDESANCKCGFNHCVSRCA